MYKMLIVDDQIAEIEGIKYIADWKQLGIEIVGEATNGKQGVEEAIRLKPDIIITDIVMPLLDGLQMIDRIKEHLPDIKVIFISCFDDFKFVSEAINKGAFGYVLKPILTGELVTAVNKTLGICEREKKSIELLMLKQKINESMESLREHFLRNTLLGVFTREDAIAEQSRFLDIKLSGKLYCACNIELEGCDEEQIFFHGVSIIEKLRYCFEADNEIYFILLDLNHISLILVRQIDDKTEMKKSVINNVQKIIEFIWTEFNISATAGLGLITEYIQEISKSHKTARTACNYKFYLGKQRVIDFEEVEFKPESFKTNFDELNDRLKQIVFSSKKEMIDDFINTYLSLELSQDMLEYVCYTIINSLQLIMSQLKKSSENIINLYGSMVDTIASMENIIEMKKYIKGCICSLIDYSCNTNKVENSELVEKMKNYILKNLQTQILIENVASNVFLSAGHANYIFKNLTGKTLHQYMEEMRMEKSLALLEDKKEHKIYDVAEKLGFSNSAHFINTFKKYYGCTPSEFRKRSTL